MIFTTMRNPNLTIDIGKAFEEVELKSNYLNISFRHALCLTLECYHECPDASGSHALNYVIALERKEIASPDLSWTQFQDQAQSIIEFWGLNFMQARLQGISVFTRWQQGVINLVKDPHHPVNLDDLKIVVTLPKFTQTQKQINNLVEKYNPWDGVVTTDEFVDLRLVDVVRRGSAKRRASTWYAFADKRNQLMIMEIPDNDRASLMFKPMLEKILAVNNQKLCAQVDIAHRQINQDFSAGSIFRIRNIQ
jgi:hypothetical protein